MSVVRVETSRESIPLNVLVVEEDEGRAQRFVGLLRDKGYDVTWRRVDDAEGLREALNDQYWDIALACYGFPRLSGPQIVSILQAYRRDLPFLLVTESIGERLAVQVMQAGARDIVSVHDLPRLASAVERAIQDSRERRVRRDAAAELRAAEARYRSLVELMPAVIWQWPVNIDGPPQYVSPQIEAMSGYSREQWLSGEVRWWELIHPDDREEALAADATLVNEGTPYSISYRFFRRNGEIGWAHDHMALVRGDNEQEPYLQGILLDVTELKQAEAALSESEGRYRSVIETSLDAVTFMDVDGTLLSANLAAARMFGFDSARDMVGSNILDLVWEEHRECVHALARSVARDGVPATTEVTYVHRDGTRFPAESTMTVSRSTPDGPISLVTVTRDLTGQKAYEEQLRHQALHDGLTGLPNRSLFADRLEHGVKMAARDGRTLAVLLMDLDGFKEVNDTLGHHFGDEILKLVSVRLEETLRQSDTIARLGGDEFAILLSDADLDGGIAAADKLLVALAEPFVLNEHTFYIGCSIGIVAFPEMGNDPSALLRHADVAMYMAKRAGGGSAIYQSEADPHSTRRLDLIAGLRRAVENGDLTLHYQPKVDLGSGGVCEVEALLRWIHPEHGSVPPDQFIGIAEQTGLIRPLTTWVIQEAVRQAQTWKDAGRSLRVAVNLSTWNLQDPHLPESVQALLADAGTDASLLQLEITESALMADPERALETVQRLHDLGITISIDDFGTGYSSLGYLQRLPVNEVKIDRSFVRDMTATSNGSSIIVRSVIDLGHNLGLKVVAEGVETGEHMGLLTLLGCDQAQGYLFSRPLPPEDLDRWLSGWDPRMTQAG